MDATLCVVSLFTRAGYSFGVTPYFLRTVRTAVVYLPEYRHKYAGFVKWKTLWKAWVSTSLSILVFGGILFAISATHYV